jgi:hypothetical protein
MYRLPPCQHSIVRFVFAGGVLWSSVARADDIGTILKLAQSDKDAKIITSFDLNTKERRLDLVLAPPLLPVNPEFRTTLAVQAASTFCVDAITRFSWDSAWTVRVFLPGETSPAAICRFP